MKPAIEQRAEIFKFTMVLTPPPLDNAWRKRKRSRETGLALRWIPVGAAFMLLVVIIAGWRA